MLSMLEYHISRLSNQHLMPFWKNIWLHACLIESKNSRLPLKHEYSHVTEYVAVCRCIQWEEKVFKTAGAVIIELMADKELDGDYLVG